MNRAKRALELTGLPLDASAHTLEPSTCKLESRASRLNHCSRGQGDCLPWLEPPGCTLEDGLSALERRSCCRERHSRMLEVRSFKLEQRSRLLEDCARALEIVGAF